LLPATTVGEAGLTVIEVKIGAPPLLATVSEALLAAPPSEAPMAVDPAAAAVASPEELIVATDGLELVQLAEALTS